MNDFPFTSINSCRIDAVNNPEGFGLPFDRYLSFWISGRFLGRKSAVFDEGDLNYKIFLRFPTTSVNCCRIVTASNSGEFDLPFDRYTSFEIPGRFFGLKSAIFENIQVARFDFFFLIDLMLLRILKGVWSFCRSIHIILMWWWSRIFVYIFPCYGISSRFFLCFFVLSWNHMFFLLL